MVSTSPATPSPLAGKTALITGASGALGSDVARSLVNRGVRVALVARSTDTLEKLAHDLGGPEHALPISANVRNLSSITTAAKAAADHFGGIDIVVAGAGMATTKYVDAYPGDTFADDIDTNLVGVWRTFKATLPFVTAARGHLCAISSMAAYVHLPGLSAYSASKAGVVALCDSLRLELKGTGVSVGTVNPTFFDSAIGDALETDPDLMDATGGFTGPFSPLKKRDLVVDAVVASIEKRSRTMVLPRMYQVASLIPGAVQATLDHAVRWNLQRARKRAPR